MGILINLISVVLLCLGGLLGFFLGFKKAIIKLSIFLFLVIIGFWISKPLSKFILSFSFASISNFLKSFLGKYISNAIIDKSYYLNLLIKNISIAVLRVIIFIIWVILSLLSTNLILLLFNKKIKKDKVQKTSLRIWGGAIGIFQVVVFIFTLSSPLAGIKFFLEKTNLSSFDAFPLRTSGYIIFDNLFSIKYQNREINLRHDFEVLVENEKIIKEDFNPKEVVQILFDLESIEIIGASFIEVLLLYKNKQEPLTFEMIRAIDKISYYNELEQIELLLDYTYLLEDVSLTYYSQLDSNVIINLVEILEKMKLIDLLLPSYLEDIENKLDFNLYGIYLDELDLEDIIWTKEIAVWKEVYQCFLNMGFTYYNQNLDFKGINPNDIKDLSRCLSSSQILELNPKQILKILMDNFLLREYELDFKKITSENLEEILLFVKLLGENNFFTKKFSSTEFLTDENVEETINILLGSEFCRKNLKTILLLMFKEKNKFSAYSF